MVDNLFIVESPLQALVAVELSLQFEGQTNGIIYRLSGKGRERNDEQMFGVIDLGEWSFSEPVKFAESGGILWHINCRKYIVKLKKRFRCKVRNLFFGEFRSQWMHFARFAVAPEKYVLIDDGAATLTVKSLYIDQGVFYPKELLAGSNPLKKAVREAIFLGLFDKRQAQKPVTFASAFLREQSEFKVDFSYIRQRVGCFSVPDAIEPSKAYFFGSKYSEVGILTRSYELEFISGVLNHYQRKGLDLVYCAHRDESEEKLALIRMLGDIELVRPDLPAELFVLERDKSIAEIGAAYSSVINNLRLIFPDKPITSFRLSARAINPTNRDAIDHIYNYFEKEGILIKSW